GSYFLVFHGVFLLSISKAKSRGAFCGGGKKSVEREFVLDQRPEVTGLPTEIKAWEASISRLNPAAIIQSNIGVIQNAEEEQGFLLPVFLSPPPPGPRPGGGSSLPSRKRQQPAGH